MFWSLKFKFAKIKLDQNSNWHKTVWKRNVNGWNSLFNNIQCKHTKHTKYNVNGWNSFFNSDQLYKKQKEKIARQVLGCSSTVGISCSKQTLQKWGNQFKKTLFTIKMEL